MALSSFMTFCYSARWSETCQVSVYLEILTSCVLSYHSSLYSSQFHFAYFRWGDCQTTTIYSNSYGNSRTWFRPGQVSTPSQTLLLLTIELFILNWITFLNFIAWIPLEWFWPCIFLLSLKRENTTVFFGPPFETKFEAHYSEGTAVFLNDLTLMSSFICQNKCGLQD